ncbi:hypothetical protein GDO86_009110 [Hymenochirus boettgeri]|uniref:Uncharacterized protein n=1 Tax=Hymenochirus boettgeri TaxID=247094 RepID=A0A8T2JKF8_9PIPI|nr:hypothetical protein GDO86_009110 [Hymenochirus boettgeri]
MNSPSLRKRPAGQTNLRSEPVLKQPTCWGQWEILIVCSSFLLLMYIWFCYENFHFHVTHFYAHLGYTSAQHMVGQRYLRGVGVKRDVGMAVQWLSRASQNTLENQ